MSEIVERLKELSEKATKGPYRDSPWHWGRADVIAFDDTSKNKVNGQGYVNVLTDGTFADAKLVATLLNGLPEILSALSAADLIEQQAREIARLRQVMTELRDDMLMRAKMNRHLHDGDIVVEASSGVWYRFNRALEKSNVE